MTLKRWGSKRIWKKKKETAHAYTVRCILVCINKHKVVVWWNIPPVVLHVSLIENLSGLVAQVWSATVSTRAERPSSSYSFSSMRWVTKTRGKRWSQHIALLLQWGICTHQWDRCCLTQPKTGNPWVVVLLREEKKCIIILRYSTLVCKKVHCAVCHLIRLMGWFMNARAR